MVTSTKGVANEIPSDKVQQKELADTEFHESLPSKTESPLHVLSKQELVKIQEREIPDTKAVESQSSQDGSELTTMMEKVSNNSQLTKSPDRKNQASLSNQETNSQSVIPKASDDRHQRPGPDSGIHTSQSNQEGFSLSVMPDKKLDNMKKRQSPDSGINSAESNQEGRTLTRKPEKVSPTLQQTQGLDVDVRALESDQGKFTLAIRSEKVLEKLPLRRNPDTVVHAIQSDQEEVTFSKVPEKPSVDGYNWRKYGQKLVRGNTFIRSYYKCTFSNCPAKKQVERSHDGRITEINYLRKHEHPKPPQTLLKGTAFVLPIQARKPDETSLTKSEDESSVHGVTSHDTEAAETHQLSTVAASDNFVDVAVSQSSEIRSVVNDNGEPDSKRQKKDISSVSDSVVTKTNCEPRVVVQTTSEVDIVNDGYRWRKYGQKLVKGNPNPRSYYRCSIAGCPVKKHVERASHDQKVVITTYEGRHDHEMPGGRTVIHNTSGNNTRTTSPNDDEPTPKAEPNETVGMDVVVHVSAT